MNQILSAVYFLPAIICLVWTFIYSFRVKATTQKMMLALLILCTFYFVTYAFYISPWTDYRVMAWLDMFNIPVALIILAVDLIFVSTHHSRQLLESRHHLLLYVPVFVLSSIDFLLVYLIGNDDIARFSQALDRCGSYPEGFDTPLMLLFYNFNMHFLNYVLFAFILVIVYRCVSLSWYNGYRPGDIFRFFFRGNESNPVRVVSFLNVLTLCLLVPLVPLGNMGRTFLISHPAIGCTTTLLLSVTVFCLCYVEYMIDIPRFTLSSLAHVSFGGHQSAPVAVPQPVGEESADADIPESVAASSIPVRVEERDRIESALRRAFDHEQVYRNPDLSIVGLASQLGTNRTTLSQIISQSYGVNFRQLLARYRVDAAKAYMLRNPEAKQEEVAIECGFITAQAFNQKFKELVGDAPRMWMVKQRKS